MLTPLMTIGDLKVNTDLRPYVELVQGLGDHYLRFIENDVDGYHYDVQAGAESARKPGVHASEVSGCARRLVYGIAGTERRPDPHGTDANMRMRFRLGQAVHAMLQGDLERMCRWSPYVGPDGNRYQLTFVPEVPINSSMPGAATEHDVESSTDGVITFWLQEIPVLRILLEIKTSSALEYEKIKEPKSEHLEQTHIYMACLDVPFTWMLYYNKSNSNFTKPYAPFFFRFSQKIWDGLEIRLVVNQHLATIQSLPERTEGMHCRWCPFSYTCKPSILERRGQPQQQSRQNNAWVANQFGRKT